MIDEEGEARAAQLAKRFGNAFPAAYRENVSARAAVADVQRLDGLALGGLALNLYRPLEAPAGRLGFKVYRAGEPVALSDSLPMLEHMGVRVLSEQPYEVGPERGDPFWIHDFELDLVGHDEIDAESIAPLFEDAFRRVMTGEVENDDFNRLVLLASLSADEITVLRAYAKYMRQIGFALSQAFIEATLANHPRHRAAAGAAVQAPVRPEGGGRCRGDEPGERDRAGAGEGRAACPRTACCGSTSR